MEVKENSAGCIAAPMSIIRFLIQKLSEVGPDEPSQIEPNPLKAIEPAILLFLLQGIILPSFPMLILFSLR